MSRKWQDNLTLLSLQILEEANYFKTFISCNNLFALWFPLI